MYCSPLSSCMHASGLSSVRQVCAHVACSYKAAARNQCNQQSLTDHCCLKRRPLQQRKQVMPTS
jgi:hypothetical protein